MMVVEASEAAAREAWDRHRAHRGLPPQAFAFVGTAEHVAEQVGTFLDAGVDEVIVELPEAHDSDAVRAASKALEMAVHAGTQTLSEGA
jgi:alkanesulfonate monooxygenase SsuD/methylene tetrahydromethanopterin reductase-like flavin-dependent oxidoreductase (luciferase family)